MQGSNWELAFLVIWEDTTAVQVMEVVWHDRGHFMMSPDDSCGQHLLIVEVAIYHVLSTYLIFSLMIIFSCRVSIRLTWYKEPRLIAQKWCQQDSHMVIRKEFPQFLNLFYAYQTYKQSFWLSGIHQMADLSSCSKIVFFNCFN